MVEIGDLVSGIFNAYNSFLSTLPQIFQNFINLFLLVLVIVIYSVLIWKFYRFIGTKNIFHLNLNQYNKAEHPAIVKILATIFYLVEYIIILPFVIFFWFVVFALFLIILTENLSLETILLVSVTIIAAIRMTAYIPGYGENLAKEIAKLLPFTLLAVTIVNPVFWSSSRFSTVITHLNQIGGLTGIIFDYLIFIIVLEVILRAFEFFFILIGLEDTMEAKKREEEE